MGIALALTRRRRRRRRRPRGFPEWARIVGWLIEVVGFVGLAARGQGGWALFMGMMAWLYWADTPRWLRPGPAPPDTMLSPLGAGTLLRRWLVGDPE